MNWKAFVASIVASLAWPSVVAVLLILLRKQLGGLAERLDELSLGSAKAKFKEQINELKGSRRRETSR